MARYEITRACGHSETVQIRGTNVRGERERRAGWLAEQPCTDCVRTARQAERDRLAARAATIAGAEGWPELVGSPRQIGWAQDIRMSLVAEVVATICGGHDGDPLAEVINDVVRQRHGRGDLRDWGGADREQIAGVYITALLRQIEARWWVDRRDLAQRVLGRPTG